MASCFDAFVIICVVVFAVNFNMLCDFENVLEKSMLCFDVKIEGFCQALFSSISAV